MRLVAYLCRQQIVGIFNPPRAQHEALSLDPGGWPTGELVWEVRLQQRAQRMLGGAPSFVEVVFGVGHPLARLALTYDQEICVCLGSVDDGVCDGGGCRKRDKIARLEHALFGLLPRLDPTQRRAPCEHIDELFFAKVRVRKVCPTSGCETLAPSAESPRARGPPEIPSKRELFCVERRRVAALLFCYLP